MFKSEPSRKLKVFFQDIDIPATKLKEVHEIIKIFTCKMKKKLDKNDPWQTHTYLNTSREFEKIFKKDDSIDEE